MICIYKITNPKNKIYIGKTKNYHKRISQYKRLHCKSQKLLYRSFLKYGVENHKFEIITECSFIDLPKYESYYIDLYDSIKTGLNLRNSADSNRSFSDELRKIFSEVKKGNKNPNYNKKTWNAGIKQWAAGNHPFKGKKLTEEHKQKLFKSNYKIFAKGSENLRSVKINQFSISGEFIKHWGSSQDIFRTLNIDSSSIIKCCRGKLKTCKGYIFKYASDCKTSKAA